MHFTSLDETAWQFELNQYLKSQVAAVAPALKPLVPAKIRVERVGFTRNASNTPYIVYWANNRRCCTFIKRKVFLELVQVLLKLTKAVEDKIRSVTCSLYFGLSVKTSNGLDYIPSIYVRKFFEFYNEVAVEWISPQSECDCDKLFGFCPHAIAQLLFRRSG